MFISTIFPVFLGIVIVLFFLLPVKWRPGILLLSSYAFCGWIDRKAMIVLILISLLTYAAGIRIESYDSSKKRIPYKLYTGLIIGCYIFLLCMYKYTDSLVIPVGLSFYSFQAIGYLSDICQKNIRAERNFLSLGCFLAFFPKLVSGPIERAQDFLPQMKQLKEVRFWDRGRLSTAAAYMLWGYFMKMVVADRLVPTVNSLFGNPEAFDSFWLLCGVFFYTMQIYCDFAGYSYIAIGCARLFGLRFTHNFEAPYCSAGIAEFWRRWHISLSRWLRDYLYIPLGGNRKGAVRKRLNTLIVFLVCGMWHGAGLHFIFWGLLHGFYMAMESFFRQKGSKIKGGRFLTFSAVSFAWIFFRADSLRAAFDYIYLMFTTGFHPALFSQTMLELQLNPLELCIIGGSILLVLITDELCSRKKTHLPLLIQQQGNAVRYLIFYLLIVTLFVLGIYGPGYQAKNFIYMQF